MKQSASEDFSLGVKLLTAGTAACIADLATFPLDTAKVRMQVRNKAYRPFVTYATRTSTGHLSRYRSEWLDLRDAKVDICFV